MKNWLELRLRAARSSGWRWLFLAATLAYVAHLSAQQGSVPPNARSTAQAVMATHSLSVTSRSTFTVTYHGFSQAARDAFQAAIDIWASELDSPVPIRVDAFWQSIPPGPTGVELGNATAEDFAINFPNAPKLDTWYPIALANRLVRSDLTPGAPHITATFNSDVAWYTGVDGHPGTTQYEFLSVVLHEIAHGLGFYTDVLYLPNGNTFDWVGRPSVLDRFAYECPGGSLCLSPSIGDAYPNPPPGPTVQSGNVWFDAQGTRARLFAPLSWEAGSSLSHLDENEYGVICDPLCHVRLNSLMTPAQPAGMSMQDVGPLTRSLLREIGWFTPFTKISPAPDQTFPDTVNPTLQWGPSDGAANYQYCVSLIPNSCSGAWTSVGKNLSVALSGLAADTTYYWQIKAQNGHWSEEADVPPDSALSTGEWRSFRVTYHSNVNGPFGKSAPLNGQIVSGTNATLQWLASPTQPASFYYWCADTIDNNSCDTQWTQTFVLSSGQILFPTVTVLPGTKYYWQAVAGPGAAPSANGGQWWSFQGAGNLPGAFSKVTPANFAIVPGAYTTLAWAPSSNADSYEYCIDLEDTNDSVCQADNWKPVPAALNVTTGITEAPTFVAAGRLLPSTRYFWQVRAVNAAGRTEANSGVWWRLDTSAALPGSFSKTSPVMRATHQPTSVPLRWESAGGSTSYRVCVDTTNNGLCEGGWTSVGTSLSVTALNLAYSTTYYWQIEALNAQGTTAADGGAWFRFTTLGAPAAFSKAAPANGALNQGAGLVLPLVWSGSDDASAYRYCVDTVADDICNGWTDVGSNLTASPGLSPDTTYYWQVEAQNAVGITAANGGAWWSFRTVGLPGGFGKSSPANLATGRPTSLSLVWQTSADAGGYEYCIDSSNDNACAASWIDIATNQSVSLNGLAPGTTYYWQVRSRNVFGSATADGTNWWSFTTAAATPPAGVVTHVATGITQVGATLNGTVNPNGSTTTALFDYGPSSLYGSQIAVVPSPGSGTTNVPVSATIATGLACGTTYHFRLVATNTGGTSYGNDQTFATSACVVPGPTVVTLAATNVTATRATLNGTVNPNGASTTAFFQLGTTTGYGLVGTLFQPGSGTSTVTVDNIFYSLGCGTLYHFRFVATNASGTTNGSDLTFTTTACPPPAPPLVRTDPATNITSAGGATLNAMLNPRGLSTTALFEYGPTTAYGNQVAVSVSPGSGSFWVAVNAALTGLACNADYHFRVVASNTGGSSSGSDATFQACQDPPFGPGVAIQLDPAFGAAGRTIVPFSGAAVATDMALQPDGRAIVVGSVEIAGVYQLAMARFNPDGSLDASFGTGGKVTSDFFRDHVFYSSGGGGSDFTRFDAAVALQPDGRIVVAGAALGGGFGVARFLANGQLDPAFGTGGKVSTLQGTTDKFFNEPLLPTPCVPLVAAYDVALYPDGRIVVVGKARQFIPSALNPQWGAYFNDESAVVRYNPDGSLDSSFSPANRPGVCPSTSGVLVRSMDYPYPVGLPLSDEDFASGVAVLPDGKILVGASAGFVDMPSGPDLRSPSLLVRLWPDGIGDSTFSTSPRSGVLARSNDSLPIGSSLWTSFARQADGRLIRLEAASSSFTGVGRQSPDGRPDGTFGLEGFRDASGTGAYSDVAVTSDGDIVLVGPGGSVRLQLIPSIGVGSSYLAGDFAGASGASIALQSDGQFLIAGTAPVGASTGFLIERMSIATRAPVVLAPLASQTVLLGQDAVLSVAASGVPAAYKWQWSTGGNWGFIGDQAPYWTGTQTRTLTIHANAFMNGTKFRCVVTNVWGSVRTNEPTLTVLSSSAPPVITQPPTSLVVRIGQSAAFGVTAVGSPTLSYRWQISTNGGASWTDLVNAAPYSGVTTAALGVTSAPRILTGAQYRCVVSNPYGSATSSPAILAVAAPSPGDFDGDGRADVTVFRPSSGTWYIRNSLTGLNVGLVWGGAGDVPVVGDYDGDGLGDMAVFRPSNGTWYLRSSINGSLLPPIVWGGVGDVPVPGDYDGDGKTDAAVFRPSNGTWYVRHSSTGALFGLVWGGAGDVASAGDYDGDGLADLAVFRPSNGTWYLRNSTTGALTSVVWGGPGDVAVPGDYDADGRTDTAVFRASTGIWYIRNSSTGLDEGLLWGGAGDVPVPGDYDGDGKTDMAVFRPSTGTWYLRSSINGTLTTVVWGGVGDIPVLRRQ